MVDNKRGILRWGKHIKIKAHKEMRLRIVVIGPLSMPSVQNASDLPTGTGGCQRWKKHWLTKFNDKDFLPLERTTIGGTSCNPDLQIRCWSLPIWRSTLNNWRSTFCISARSCCRWRRHWAFVSSYLMRNRQASETSCSASSWLAIFWGYSWRIFSDDLI